ncbi:MAG: hypothetical protein OXJ53_03620 [Gammaproteobacteria bacterium]|nr:hypothetical protein [Gammaproteobacteria bacterium]MDE0273769.1 hypothetical protein [Gammaproteobacteria bacterium]
MGTLKVGALDFNDIGTVEVVRDAIAEMASRPDSYHALQFKSSYYFQVTDLQLPSEAGWYIILDGTLPLYVGQANNLNARLNTSQGSTDNFGQSDRTSDPERNFIKKFIEVGVIQTPRVCIIRSSELAAAVGTPESRLTNTDKGNIEKFINLMRNGIAYM